MNKWIIESEEEIENDFDSSENEEEYDENIGGNLNDVDDVLHNDKLTKGIHTCF